MACVIPIHIWSLFNTFTEVPAWVIKMSLWDVLGAIAYTQVFALLETVLFALLLAVLFFVLPRFLVGGQVAPIGMMILIVATIWLIILQLNANWIDDRNAPALAIWGISFAVLLGISMFFVRRSEKLQGLLQNVSDRIVVLAVFLLFIDFLSVSIVVIRNFAGVPS